MAVRKIMIVAGLVVLAACMRFEPPLVWVPVQWTSITLDQAFVECKFEQAKTHGYDWIDTAWRRAEVLVPCMNAKGFRRAEPIKWNSPAKK